MKKYIIITYIVLCIAVCIFGIFSGQNGNTFDKGYQFYLPIRGQVVGNDLTISGSVYAKAGIDKAFITLTGDNYENKIPIEFEQVIYKNKILETLSTFKINLNLEDGEYIAQINAVTSEGKVLTFDRYPISVNGNSSLKAFAMFGTEHLITMAVLLVLGIFLIRFFMDKPNGQQIMRYTVIFIMMISDIYLRSWLINNGTFKASYDMTLHMCDIGAIILAGMMLTDNQKLKQNLYNMLFIWGIGGAFMAILTPEMGGYGFPSFYYFNFFTKHFAIILGVYIVTFFDGLRPQIKQLPRVLIISTVLVTFIYGLNQLLRSIPPYEVGNYMFIGYPPLGGSAIDIMVDIFGPSPFYYIGMLILGVIVFVVLSVPFWIEKTIKNKRIDNISDAA